IDFRLHTNGYAMAANIGKIKSYYLTTYYHFEVGELKHHKEIRLNDFNSNPPITTTRSYVFGKQNNLFVVRAGYGRKRYFSEKAKRKGLAVGINYQLGPSIGLLKPYYLEVTNPIDNDGGRTLSIRYSEDNSDLFLDKSKIQGASGFLKGWNDVSINPGAQAKFALHFDWGAFDEIVKAFEAGIMADFYFRKMPIMVENELIDAENRPFFINLYLTLQFGKRW
ncbi:MAG: hypothetical protein AAFO94_13865, partial [Bacteroidota bacterium]